VGKLQNLLPLSLQRNTKNTTGFKSNDILSTQYWHIKVLILAKIVRTKLKLTILVCAMLLLP
jgi:hypothetical protein